MAVAAAALAVLAGCAISPPHSAMRTARTCTVPADCAPLAAAIPDSLEPEAASGPFTAMIRDLVSSAPSVNAALTRWQVEVQKVAVARAALRPGAELFSESGIRGAYGLTKSTTNPYSYGIRVSVPVYDGDRGLNTANQQAMVSIAAKQSAIDELASTILDLVGASASVRHSDAVIRIRGEQISAVRKLLEAVKAEQTSGTASSVDIDQVQSQLNSLDIERRRAEGDRAQAVQSFTSVTGTPPGDIAAIGSIKSGLPQSASDAEAMAASDNPRIAHILALRTAASFDKRVADAGNLPTVSLDLEASRSGAIDLAGSEETDFSALIRFALPLPIGGSVRAQQRQKALELRAANLEVDATRNGVFAGVAAAFERLGLSRQGYALARSGVTRAKSMLDGIRTERELGERSVFDELSALNAYAEARIKAADMEYEVIVAEHLLAAQTGQIADIYGISVRN